MTAIAAVALGGTVWMAADSRSADGFDRIWTRAPSQPKIVMREVDGRQLLLASEGAGELEAIARHDLQVDGVPDVDDDGDCDAWAHRIAEALAEIACDRKPPATGDSGDVAGRWLLGFGGRVWMLASGASLRTPWFTAIGGGGDLALGALAAADAAGQLTIELVTASLHRAISIACEFNAGCGRPVHMAAVPSAIKA